MIPNQLKWWWGYEEPSTKTYVSNKTGNVHYTKYNTKTDFIKAANAHFRGEPYTWNQWAVKYYFTGK